MRWPKKLILIINCILMGCLSVTRFSVGEWGYGLFFAVLSMFFLVFSVLEDTILRKRFKADGVKGAEQRSK
ncbi:hypothetical protein GJU40_16940 [Bacillus lacus]|uniref:Lipoprotein n=1 Tax=Metabacillus lacus TaxID=1983721 RepID=A0A7X2J1P7_9BACI|nr:hypothetical protein [Metabacillus lacus]MRX73831.1 hypothetical protein [Metabacillus lacus]